MNVDLWQNKIQTCDIIIYRLDCSYYYMLLINFVKKKFYSSTYDKLLEASLCISQVLTMHFSFCFYFFFYLLFFYFFLFPFLFVYIYFCFYFIFVFTFLSVFSFCFYYRKKMFTNNFFKLSTQSLSYLQHLQDFLLVSPKYLSWFVWFILWLYWIFEFPLKRKLISRFTVSFLRRYLKQQRCHPLFKVCDIQQSVFFLFDMLLLLIIDLQ